MNNQLQIFKNNEFGEIRTITINNEPWFVGKDIAKALGYERGTKAVQDHVDVDDLDEIPIQDSIGRMQKTPVINESGFYSLVLGSKLKSAKRFKRWVTSEVLPSIRKNGGYIADQENLSNEQILAKAVIVAQNVIAEKEKLLKEKEEYIIEMKPKVEYHDTVLNKDGLIPISTIAKDLGTTAIQLNKLLHNNGIIYRVGNCRTWYPYVEYNWLVENDYADYQSYKNSYCNPILKWTEKGRKWIIENYTLWLEKEN